LSDRNLLTSLTSLVPDVFEKVFIVLSLSSCKAELCFLFDSRLGDTLTAKIEAGRGQGFLKAEWESGKPVRGPFIRKSTLN